MHNNNNYPCKICWNKAVTFGVGSIQLSFRTIVFTQTCKDVFNPNVTTFQSNCAEGLHFSAFHYFSIKLLANLAKLKGPRKKYLQYIVHMIVIKCTLPALSGP